REMFTAEESDAIRDHVPWTRVVEPRKTIVDGKEIDLVPYILKHRTRFVLKPNDSYWGKGIVLGWESDETTWENTVHKALQEPYVVQDRIDIP
ncbi:hypothetical protein ACSTJA_23620, partial [Vibrio parahaemolyticus]